MELKNPKEFQELVEDQEEDFDVEKHFESFDTSKLVGSIACCKAVINRLTYSLFSVLAWKLKRFSGRERKQLMEEAAFKKITEIHEVYGENYSYMIYFLDNMQKSGEDCRNVLCLMREVELEVIDMFGLNISAGELRRQVRAFSDRKDLLILDARLCSAIDLYLRETLIGTTLMQYNDADELVESITYELKELVEAGLKIKSSYGRARKFFTREPTSPPSTSHPTIPEFLYEFPGEVQRLAEYAGACNRTVKTFGQYVLGWKAATFEIAFRGRLLLKGEVLEPGKIALDVNNSRAFFEMDGDGEVRKL